MAEERVITLNLRKWLKKEPRWKRSKQLMGILKEKLKRELKTDIKIDKRLNERVWERGIRKTYAKLKLRIRKDDKKAKIELVE